MRRVVITGIGIVSSIGNNKKEVVRSLSDGKSGIRFCEAYSERGFRSHVHGEPNLDIDENMDRKWRRFMGDGAAYNYIAMQEALSDAGLEKSDIVNPRTGLIMGSGGPSTKNLLAAFDAARDKGAKKVGPFMVPRTMSSTNSDTLATAFDANRDGFVIAGGGGVVVLEELEHAKARGAKIYAEFAGYGATSDGFDMVQPSGEGAIRCMEMALAGVDMPVDYINTHGTSTPVGDVKELAAIRHVFGKRNRIPAFASTKSLTGHSLGAAGVQEAIYSLLMMEHKFIAASANVDKPDQEVGEMPLVTEKRDQTPLNCVLSNSFGFGGTNASLVFRSVSV